MRERTEGTNHIHLLWKQDAGGRKYLIKKSLEGRMDGESLWITLEGDGAGKSVTFPVYQQKAGNYGKYSEYMNRHGCACCSLTALLAAYVPKYRNLRPEETVGIIERACWEEAWRRNYRKHIARQMPVSLYGISRILQKNHIPHRYVGRFEDGQAMKEMEEHLGRGRPVVIETSRMRRKNGRIVRWFDKKYAGSYHTMVLLGIDERGRVLFTDSAQRQWAGSWQRLKKAKLSDLIAYMFPQKNESDTHVYFHRRKDTGGYILIDLDEPGIEIQ